MRDRNVNHSDNWATPDYIYDPLNEEFGFDFDPCPLNEGIITDDTNGLIIDWGYRNFVNPPYSRSLKEKFVMKAAALRSEGKMSVLLLPVSTSTVLFHDVILPNASDIRFVRKRIKFIGTISTGEPSKGGGMHDSMIVIFSAKGA